MSVKPVLLVEDDADLRDALTAVLEVEGYTVVSAADGEEGLDRLRSGLEPAVIVLDLRMPGKNGGQFRAEQTATPRFAAVPVVLVSADPDLDATARALGVDEYVAKPLDPDEFLRAVAHHRSG